MATEYINYEADPQLAIEKCAACLLAGGTAVIPTGTVYGLLAYSESVDAYHQLFKIKHRTPGKPISLLCAEGSPTFVNMLVLLREHDDLHAGFCAGEITVVVDPNRVEGLPGAVQKIQPGTVGVRHPANSPACAVIETLGGLAWGTSANFSGHPPCSTAPETQTWLRQAKPAPDLAILSREPQQGQASRVVKLLK